MIKSDMKDLPLVMMAFCVIAIPFADTEISKLTFGFISQLWLMVHWHGTHRSK